MSEPIRVRLVLGPKLAARQAEEFDEKLDLPEWISLDSVPSVGDEIEFNEFGNFGVSKVCWAEAEPGQFVPGVVLGQ
jgi:hypothetical protein